MPSELLIIGTGGMAREAAQLARQIDPVAMRWTSISFVTEDPSQLGQQLGSSEISLTDDLLLQRTEPVDVVIGIGHPKVRQRIAQQIAMNEHFLFPNLIHPSVDIDFSRISLGPGNIVAKGVHMSCDVVVGSFNIFNWYTTVGHDVRVGSYNVINPNCNLSGFVAIGDSCLVGTGSQILESLTISDGVKVGAGAVVTRSLVEAGTYVGIPARLLSC